MSSGTLSTVVESQTILRERTAILREQYKHECDDNSELYRRAAFVYVLITALGTISIKLAFTIRTSPGLFRDPRIVAAGAVVAALAMAAICLWFTLRMRDWAHPKLDELELARTGDAVRLTPDEKLIREYAHAVRQNREQNRVRFDWLHRSLVVMSVAAGLMLVQCVAHAVYGWHRVQPAPPAASP